MAASCPIHLTMEPTSSDDAHGDGLRQGLGAAHGEHGIPHSEARGVAEGGDGEVARLAGEQLDDADVGDRVGADELGVDVLAADKGADDLLGLAGDVMVGEDVTFLGEDDAAAR